MKYGHVFQLRSWSCFPSNATVFFPMLHFFLRQPNPACFVPEHRGRTGTLLTAGIFCFAQASFPGPAHILVSHALGQLCVPLPPPPLFPQHIEASQTPAYYFLG